jgi:hypothetical protein
LANRQRMHRPRPRPVICWRRRRPGRVRSCSCRASPWAAWRAMCAVTGRPCGPLWSDEWDSGAARDPSVAPAAGPVRLDVAPGVWRRAQPSRPGAAPLGARPCADAGVTLRPLRRGMDGLGAAARGFRRPVAPRPAVDWRAWPGRRTSCIRTACGLTWTALWRAGWPVDRSSSSSTISYVREWAALS